MNLCNFFFKVADLDWENIPIGVDKVNIYFQIYLVNCLGSLFFIAVMYCNST